MSDAFFVWRKTDVLGLGADAVPRRHDAAGSQLVVATAVMYITVILLPDHGNPREPLGMNPVRSDRLGVGFKF